MSLGKSYLFLAGKAINRLNTHGLGITIPEIHSAIRQEVGKPKDEHVCIVSLESAIEKGLKAGKFEVRDRFLYHLGGFADKNADKSALAITEHNHFATIEGKIWWSEE